jgi:hypothetical protein
LIDHKTIRLSGNNPNLSSLHFALPKPAKLPQLSRSIVQTEINALVTPLEKPSPRGDTGNEPVFCLRFLKEVEPVSSGQRKPQAEGRYQHGTPHATSGRNFVPKLDLTR